MTKIRIEFEVDQPTNFIHPSNLRNAVLSCRDEVAEQLSKLFNSYQGYKDKTTAFIDGKVVR